MARAPKPGLKYFSLDIDFFLDDKILLAEEYVDPNGNQPINRLLCAYIYMRLLNKIYKENGFYIAWDDKLALTFTSSIGRGLTFEMTKMFINAFLESDLLDKYAFVNDGILTSKSIITRYIFVIRNSNKKISLTDALNMQKKYNYTDSHSGGTDSHSGGTDSHSGGTVSPLNNSIVYYDLDNTELSNNYKKNKIILQKGNSVPPDSVTVPPDSVTVPPDSVTVPPECIEDEIDKKNNIYKTGLTREEIINILNKVTISSVEYQVSDALIIFFFHSFGDAVREEMILKISNAGENQEMILERLFVWGKYFLKNLLRQNMHKKNFFSGNGFQMHFRNWLLAFGVDVFKSNPDEYFNKLENKSNKKNIESKDAYLSPTKIGMDKTREGYNRMPK